MQAALASAGRLALEISIAVVGLEPRPPIEVKGKGAMQTDLVTGRRPEPRAEPAMLAG